MLYVVDLMYTYTLQDKRMEMMGNGVPGHSYVTPPVTIANKLAM